MKTASVISIGNELLSGRTVDTNAAYLCAELLAHGIPVEGIYIVSDETDAIVQKLELACAGADFVITTGGLGPTDDDITRHAFAKFLDCELQLQHDLLDQIQEFFVKRNRHMPERNKIQACIPAAAKAIVNELGTAPGIMAESKGKLLFALPGVPMEMKQMFQKTVLPEIKRLTGGQAVAVRKLNCFGAGESDVAELLGDLMQRGRNPLINCTVNFGTITLHIIAAAADKKKAAMMAEKDEKLLREKLGELVFGEGEQTLAEVVGEQLTKRKKTIAIAESCTGGWLAKLLTDMPGASRYFTHGWTTYSNQAKTSQLGVPAELIEKYGAVSEQVAESMAVCARKKAGTDYAIGITGIAGPDGGTEHKPVGFVYISLDCDEGCETKRFFFSHDRQFIRLRTTQTALNILRLHLKD
jgi:nicotinamide-nucleotide amidase